MQAQAVEAAFFGLVTCQSVELIVIGVEIVHLKAADAGGDQASGTAMATDHMFNRRIGHVPNLHAIVIELGAVAGRSPQLQLLVLPVSVNPQVRQAQMRRRRPGFGHGRPQNHHRAIGPVGQMQEGGRSAAAQSLIIVLQQQRLGDFIGSGAEKDFAVGRQGVQRLLDFRAAGIGGQRKNDRRRSERGVADHPQRQQQQRRSERFALGA